MSTCVLPKFLTPMVVRIEDYNTDRIESWKEYFRIQQVAMRNLEDVIGLRATRKKTKTSMKVTISLKTKGRRLQAQRKTCAQIVVKEMANSTWKPRLWEDTYTSLVVLCLFTVSGFLLICLPFLPTDLL